ncbi:thiamine-phosphate kinase [soil metagenome]
MQESRLLERVEALRSGSQGFGAGVVVGPGDDCAALRLDGLTLVTVDQLIEGRHFAPGTAPRLIAHKAIARSVSDIAAMAGRPVACVVTAAFAEGTTQEWAEELFDAVHAAGLALACPVIGGDIARMARGGALTLTCTALGMAHAARGAVLRSGARAGDDVYVTGAIGGSFASGRHLEFEPRVRAGIALADALGEDLHAMIDISDGLGRDAGRVARVSSVRIEIEGARVPLHAGVVEVMQAAGEGEDYELLFTAAAGSGARIEALDAGVAITRIGLVVSGAGCVIIGGDGRGHGVTDLGWDHA